MSLHAMTVHQLHELLVKREVSAEEITKAVFERIDQVENKVKAYITLTKEEAIERARQVDRRMAAGEKVSPLAGIPIAVKDNICTKDVPTTCASKMLENFVPPYNATVMEKLNAIGAVTVGKTNLDEFAIGSSTENSAFQATYNPWDLERVPGGSSGGSAAAVAADQCIAALGSDTGGSIRQPAALCGVVGLKPTYGAVSRYGLVAYASSLDQVGPITKDVTDCALMMNAICGYDPLDSTSAKGQQADYTKFLQRDIRGLKIGVPKEYMDEGLAPEMRRVIEEAIITFSNEGAVVEETSLPHSRYALSAYQIIASAEASSNLARYDGVAFGYRQANAEDILEMFIKSRSEALGDAVKGATLLGTYALSAGNYDTHYLKALKVRTLIIQDFQKALDKYDVLLSPVTPTPAFKFGEKTGHPMEMCLQHKYTLPVNLAGLPAVSIPGGFIGGLPVGLQLIGKHFSEDTLLRAAYTFEQNTDFHRKRAAL
ncbi:Asp-tRNA(Asn)/Glu-tRNA(Gln) amidotransferase subunit GatA [Desulfofalx alkaliphila]|uniref:Asp-tRNA(Asn)/Glu-tRNA(Gln) amidotransferase subunit GatA n=1 Tax=Desulfofalx alkaliphila TaxID=105483 RepID=UPI0004E19018|nr:Asp-tRNA(Asn)/Glu-tRNA(Gln) amidotransferase subunit GatA [Desulfofalx alkaliphila]